MKIINLTTNNVFDLPKADAEELIKNSPDTFARITKSKKIIKPKQIETTENNVLKQILE